jgi:diketogulonate reductase-like aldo/keto reductase
MSLTLNNGVEMPALGFGVFQTPAAETVEAVETTRAPASSASTGSTW